MSVSIIKARSFAGIDCIKRGIFDLSLVAKIPNDATVYKLITAIQQKARNQNLAVHILSKDQIHITIINPIFKIEGKHSIPSQKIQEELFHEFVESLKTISTTQTLFETPYEVNFDQIFIRESDIRLVTTRDVSQIENLQKILEVNLKEQDERFDFQEGHPTIHTTILRFRPEFSKNNYDILLGIVEESATDFEKTLLKMEITVQNLLAVKFEQLFMPWTKSVAWRSTTTKASPRLVST